MLDHSGSMEGEKFTQAQSALKYILQHLNPGDRFGLVAFSTAIEPYARGLRSADEASEAAAWVDRLSARGSTDINRALLEAVSMVDRERPTYLIFLTDGCPPLARSNASAYSRISLLPLRIMCACSPLAWAMMSIRSCWIHSASSITD